MHSGGASFSIPLPFQRSLKPQMCVCVCVASHWIDFGPFEGSGRKTLKFSGGAGGLEVLIVDRKKNLAPSGLKIYSAWR